MTNSFSVAEEVDETIETVESASYTGSQEGARKWLGWAGLAVALPRRGARGWLLGRQLGQPDAPRCQQAAPPGKREYSTSVGTVCSAEIADLWTFLLCCLLRLPD